MNAHVGFDEDAATAEADLATVEERGAGDGFGGMLELSRAKLWWIDASAGGGRKGATRFTA